MSDDISLGKRSVRRSPEDEEDEEKSLIDSSKRQKISTD